MKRILVACDGLRLPPDPNRQWDVRESLDHRGPTPSVNLRIQSPSQTLLTSVVDRCADLFKIASYTYAADQLASRGGEVDLYGHAWQREFSVHIPVSAPEFWNDKNVVSSLQETLGYASGDRWSFAFHKAIPEQEQLALDIDQSTALGEPDTVVMFSGGIDSLCAVIQSTVEHGKKPLLVGHSPAFHLAYRQRRLAEALRERFGSSWHFPYLSIAVHRTGPDPRDYTQRTRSFLYATLGAIVADGLGIKDVLLADNGVVSLNLPINDQLIGTKASRTTHPKFQWLFNRLASMVLSTNVQVRNPLWATTRAEGLEVLKANGAGDLLKYTNSCSHGRFLTSDQAHCGVCSQCIDRRFATLAAGLEALDSFEGYKLNVFLDDLPEGDPRTMATSYIRFANEVATLSGDGMFERFPQLYDAMLGDDPDQRSTAETLTSMVRRFGQSVLNVLAEQFALAKVELARQSLPPNCLLRLIAASPAGRSVYGFRHSPGYREVWLLDKRYSLTTNQGRVVELLHENHAQGTITLSQAYILEELNIKSKNLSQVFRGSDAWGKLVVRGDSPGIYCLNLNSLQIH